MKEQFEAILNGKRLSAVEAETLMLSVLEEPVNVSAVGGLLVALRMRGVSIDELDGFARALLTLASPLDLTTPHLVDVCGTGGDSKGTFNISTATAFVLAAAGYKVAKHGNYAVSSSCGSSNVLEALGVRLTDDVPTLKRQLNASNVCFLHAPLFHPAMKRVAPIRKELGFRTVFNMLGPLVNPARPSIQVNGVYDRNLLRLYGHLLRRRGITFATLLTSDGYDEVTLTSSLLVTTKEGEHELYPGDFGFAAVLPGELHGGTNPEGSAQLMRSLLQGRGTPAQQNVVAANAGLAMWIAEGSGTLREHVARAQNILTSGAAHTVLLRSIETI